MNIPTQYNNEAFDVLDGIADDAMSLAIAAGCVAPSYIEQCLRTVLQFHPYADRVKVAETVMLLIHDGVVVTYEIMPDEYVDLNGTDEAFEILYAVAEETIRLAGSPLAENIEECANLAIRNLKYADRVSVIETDVLSYSYKGVEAAYELIAWLDNR